MHLFFDKIIFLKERRNCISLIKNSQSFIYIYIYIFFFFVFFKNKIKQKNEKPLVKIWISHEGIIVIKPLPSLTPAYA
jgi:hypothetical protein